MHSVLNINKLLIHFVDSPNRYFMFSCRVHLLVGAGTAAAAVIAAFVHFALQHL